MTATRGQRLVLFVDAQNVYMGARDAFFTPSAPSTDGQVDPSAIAELIARRQAAAGYPCSVRQVRVYSGFHTPEGNPTAYAAYRSQSAGWKSRGCEVIGRPLRYPRVAGESPQEKGIDVALAIDFVRLALDNVFDVGVLFSTDTDLLPALEFVRDKYGTAVHVTTAAWDSDTSPRPLRMPGMWCHKLTLEDYRAVHDPTHYARPR